MATAEASGLVMRDVSESLMGHKIDLAQSYGMRAGNRRLNPQDWVREQYARSADQFLRILSAPKKVDAEGQRQTLYRGMLSDAGMDKPEIDELGHLTLDSCMAAITALRPKAKTTVTPGTRAGQEKIVEAEEGQTYMDAGWTFKGTYAGTKVVMVWPAAAGA
jgi:hypothetical protein